MNCFFAHFVTGIDGQPCGPPYRLSFVDHRTNGPGTLLHTQPATVVALPEQRADFNVLGRRA